MSAGTKIEWTDDTWNPIVGCSKISPGCQHCYAEKMAGRLAAMRQCRYGDVVDTSRGFGPNAEWNGRTALVESALTHPLHWRKPRRIFVCSMSDLFHENTPFEWVDRVFAVMALCPQHEFQLLTKRPERMREYLTETETNRVTKWGKYAGTRLPDIERAHCRVWQLAARHNATYRLPGWPLPNVWLGCTVEVFRICWNARPPCGSCLANRCWGLWICSVRWTFVVA